MTVKDPYQEQLMVWWQLVPGTSTSVATTAPEWWALEGIFLPATSSMALAFKLLQQFD